MATIRGTVKNSSGNPIVVPVVFWPFLLTSVSINIGPRVLATTSASNGVFQAELSAGQYTININNGAFTALINVPAGTGIHDIADITLEGGTANTAITLLNQTITSLDERVSILETSVSDPKDAARVATTSNLVATRTSNTLTADSNGSINGSGIDGVITLAVGDRVLVKNQSTGEDNGIWIITDLGSVSSPWVMDRTSDADTSDEVTSGLQIWVTSGTVNQNTGWLLTTPDPITLNSTSLAFIQVNGTASISAGNGIVVGGNSIHAVTSSPYTQWGVVYAPTTSALAFSPAGNGLLRVSNSAAPTVTSGTLNTIPRWDSSGTNLVNSAIIDNGTTVSSSRNLTPSGSVSLGSSSARWIVAHANEVMTYAGISNHWRLLSTGGGNRWIWYLAGSETGSNVGSDIRLCRYSDAGAFLKDSIRIQRSTGKISIETSQNIELVNISGVLGFPQTVSGGFGGPGEDPNAGITYYDSTYGTSKAEIRFANEFNSNHGTWMYFKTNPVTGPGAVTRMVISSYGNIGIGSTWPNQILDLGDGELGRSIIWGGVHANKHVASICTSHTQGSLGLLRYLRPDTSSDQYRVSFTGAVSHVGIRIGGVGGTGDIVFFNEDATYRYSSDIFNFGAATRWTILGSNGNLQANGSKSITTTSNGDLTLAPNGTGKIVTPGIAASRFVTTDASSKLVATDLLGGTNTWTGSNSFNTSTTIDSKAIARKVSGSITWSLSSGRYQMDVTHGLGSDDVIVEVYDGSSNKQTWLFDVSRPSAGVVRIVSDSDLGAGYRYVILG